VELGYLEQDHNRRYRLAPGARQSGMNAIETIRRAHPARAILEDLRAQTGHTVSLGMLDGERAVYIHRLHGHSAGQFEADGNLMAGASAPVRDTAIGNALLSCLLDSELERLLPVTEFRDQLSPTRMDELDIDEIDAELKTAIDVELAIDDGIATSETACSRSIAAPLRRWINEPILAVELTAPVDAYTMGELVTNFGKLLKRAARQISVEASLTHGHDRRETSWGAQGRSNSRRRETPGL
jgi:DNA-binding IclR family transcriptional regulator